MNRRVFILPLLLLFLVACVRAPLPLSAPQANAVLTLKVRWPAQTMAMPSDTQSLVVTVTKGDTLVKSESFPRLTDATASLNLPLKADTGLRVAVKAYRQTYVSSSSVAVAEGYAENVDLVPSKATTLQIHLTTIESALLLATTLDSNACQTGFPVTIRGFSFDDFSLEQVASMSITFNGVPAPEYYPASDSLIVRVPPNATTGPVIVRIGSMHTATESAPILWVSDGITIVADDRPEFGDLEWLRNIRLNETLQFTGHIEWRFKVGEDASTYGTPPSFTWATSTESIGTMSPTGLLTGLFTPAATGTTTVYAFAGATPSLEILLPGATPSLEMMSGTLISSPSMLVNVVP